MIAGMHAYATEMAHCQRRAGRRECEMAYRYKRAFDHLRVALAQISRTSGVAETVDFALEKLGEAMGMVGGEHG